MTTVIKEERPIPQMRPKTHSEVTTFSPKTAELTEGSYEVKRNLCLIAPLKAQEKTLGNIIIPAMAREAEEYLQQHGRVVAVGPFFYKLGAFKDDPKPIVIGDYVHYENFAGKRLDINGETFYLVKDTDIYSRVDPHNHQYKVYA